MRRVLITVSAIVLGLFVSASIGTRLFAQGMATGGELPDHSALTPTPEQSVDSVQATATTAVPPGLREMGEKISRGELDVKAHTAPPMSEADRERFKELLERTASPPFAGTINGFTFYDQNTTLPSTVSPKCHLAPTGGNNARHVSPEMAAGSRLDFTLGYWPAEFAGRSIQTEVTACEDEVVAISKWASRDRTLLMVGRSAGPPMHPAGPSLVALTPITVGAYPGIISIHEPTKRTTIFLRDGISVWTVSCGGVSTDTCIRFAEGISP